MLQDIVVGIDSSTTATKAIAFDRQGRALAEGRAKIALVNPQPGHFEQDALEWWSSLVSALTSLTSQIAPERVAAIAISNQRETFVPLTTQGVPVRPGTVWLDERAKAEVEELARAYGAERIHEVTGKPCDVTPCLYRLQWMRKHEPENFARFGMITEVHAYLAYRLTGSFVTSTASADPAAFLDMKTMEYAGELLGHTGLSVSQFPSLFWPGSVLGHVSDEAARATGLKAGTIVGAAGGDGQCAGTGVNVFVANRAYVNLGTAVVSGIYARDYAVERAFRTMTAVSDKGGYIYESVLRTGSFLVEWMLKTMFQTPPGKEKELFNALEIEANAVGIGSGGVMLLPYWAGVMTPHWNAQARGTITGLNASHGRGHVYRATLEGISLEQTIATNRAAEASGMEVDHYVAIGGGSNSDLWCQILADASGRKVARSATVEASALGAAMAAARAANWFGSVDEASAAMAGQLTDVFNPEKSASARYSELLKIYADLWPTMAAWNARLVDFLDEEKTR